MTTLKINRMSWKNFRSLTDGEIVANGRNVTISGRNGVGKSSIGGVLPFVLFGKVPSKTFDDRGLVVENCAPTATIEFDGLTLTRTLTPRNQNRTFIDGQEVPAAKFNAKVSELTGGYGTLLFDPFEFQNKHWTDRRDFLLGEFVGLDGDTAEIDEGFFTEEMRALKREVSAFPARIEEIKRQLEGFREEETLQFLEDSVKAAHEEFSKIRYVDNDREQKLLSERIREHAKLREELLAKWRSVKSTCPTCGQPLPKSKVEQTRASIVAQGKRVAAKIENLRDELETVQSKNQFSAQTALQAKKLQDTIRDLTQRIAALKNAEKLNARLEKLYADEKTFNAEIVKLEGKIAACQERRRKRLAQSEDKLNAQFEFVKFKLFKLLANGEIREDCTAMIDGVPYQNLSKGERLKAALDILNAVQRKTGRVMPLFLDDAESYTSNSFVEVPNQLFLFKVTDSDLTIVVDEGNVAACA